MVQQEPDDYWRKFDLADALLFSAEYEEADKAYDDAITAVPSDERGDTINSVLGPFRDYLTADVVHGDLLVELKKVIAKLEDAVPDSS
jgi:hypothetical protein